MKKLILFCASLAIIGTAHTQQLEAILPEGMQDAGFNAICVSYFDKAPTTSTSYDIVNGRDLQKGYITGTSEYGDPGHLNYEKAKEYVSTSQATFLVPKNKAGGRGSRTADAHLRDFVNRKIKKFNNAGFDEDSYRELQDEIWVYDILEDQKYLKHYSDVVTDYNLALKKFERDYGIESGDFDEIKKVGSELHSLNVDISGDKVIIKGEGPDALTMSIDYDQSYRNEKAIIRKNKGQIINAIKRQVIDDDINGITGKIKPYNNHHNHLLIIHTDAGDISIDLRQNTHTMLYRVCAIYSTLV